MEGNQLVKQHHENVISNLDIGVRFYESNVSNSGYVPFHWHSSIELIYVMAGQLTFKFDRHAHVVTKNQFILIPSGVVHDVTNTANRALVLQIPLHFIEKYYVDPSQLNFNLELVTNQQYQTVVTLLERLNQINQQAQPGYLFDFGSTLLQLLKVVVLACGEPYANAIHRESSGLKEIIIEINSHYYQRLSVNQLAHQFGYNPSYLSRLFKQQIGITIIEYIYEIRLSKLYQDLIQTEIPIKQLMQRHGLTNERTARTIFKQMYGRLPKQIRLAKKDALSQ